MTSPARSASQRAAVEHVRARAQGRRSEALARIAGVLDRAGVAIPVDRLLAGVRRHGRIGCNFHPDRLLGDGRTVVEALLDGGRYVSQFESGISNGGRTAYPGGDRDRWEQAMFGGAYHQAGRSEPERPKYGGLDLLGHPDGPAPRFGSCHLRLRQEVSAHATFCFGDSNVLPPDRGTIDVFEPVLAGLLEAVEGTGVALGRPATDVRGLAMTLQRTDRPAAAGTHGNVRALDDYIEVQVHGPLRLADDVEAIVVDPSFDGTATGAMLDEIGRLHHLRIERHPGFVLPLDEVDGHFRGPLMPRLAHRIGRDLAPCGGVLDAALIGRAAASVVTEPERWRDWGTTDESLQHLKQLWHVLVRFGAPAEP